LLVVGNGFLPRRSGRKGLPIKGADGAEVGQVCGMGFGVELSGSAAETALELSLRDDEESILNRGEAGLQYVSGVWYIVRRVQRLTVSLRAWNIIMMNKLEKRAERVMFYALSLGDDLNDLHSNHGSKTGVPLHNLMRTEVFPVLD
jgi:hypothetical protein